MNTLHVQPHPWEYKDDRLLISATLSGKKLPEKQLWFAVPKSLEDALSDSCDSFALGALHVAMLRGVNMKVHGPVSATLINNLNNFQKIWSIWKPERYTSIQISATEDYDHVVQKSQGPVGGSIVGFSGGVDSCFSAYRHATGSAGGDYFKLMAGVMVHGFDIPLEQEDVFDRAAERSRKLLQSLNLDLIPMATNLRDLGTDWTDIFGTAVAACLMLFQGRYTAGLIAQGVPYSCNEAFIEGSNPLTDPMLGSQRFRIVPDGAASERPDKILAMAQWSELKKYLRVCWKGEHKDRNCCRCEKCIRNILTFRLHGLGLPECFESDVDDQLIRKLNALKEFTITIGYNPILRRAAEKGINDSWIRELKKSIRRSRLIRRYKLYANFHYYRGRILKLLNL